jgi:hypothetical protein
LNASSCDRNPMRNSNAVESTSPLSSVPISLYRELCDELRHKTQELEVADHKNQRLVVQNQQLRQELQHLVQRVMQTQQAVIQMTTEFPSQAEIASPVESSTGSPLPPNLSTTPLPVRRQAMRSVYDQSSPPNAVPSAIAAAGPNASSPLTTRLWHQTNSFTQDLQGWKMAVMMGLIVLSAFGAGFLIMRPFMARQQAQPLQPQPLQQQPIQPQQMPKR